jgi:hypothetical protein
MEQAAVRCLAVISHPIPLLDHDLDIADRPECPAFDPHLRRYDLLRAVLLQLLKQLLSLFRRQFVGIPTCPDRMEGCQTTLTLRACPLARACRTAPDQLLDGLHRFSYAIQPYCLQAFEFTGITGLCFCLLKGRHFFLRELKSSVCHSAILHQ